MFVLGERATIGAIHEGYSVEFELDGCRYALLGYGITRGALERFAVGLRFEEDDLAFSAIWPEDTLAGARVACYRGRERRWPGRVAVDFVRSVLGWEGFDVSTSSGGNLRRFTFDAASAAGVSDGPDVRVYVEEVLPRCWSVNSVSPVHARRVDDSGISVEGQEVDLAFDPGGATTVAIEVGYGDDVHTATWKGGDTIAHFELDEPPESTGHFLVLRYDVRGIVFSASGGPLPPGDFTAG